MLGGLAVGAVAGGAIANSARPPPWLGEFLTEILSFPNGRYDDQVDSVSQFLRWLQNDAYNSRFSFHPPFVVARPRRFLF